MSNPNLDAEIYSWLVVAKGDKPGHPFHGNQYTTGAGGEEPMDADEASRNIATNVHTIGTILNRPLSHKEIAEAHRAVARELKKEGRSHAAQAHTAAADYWEHAPAGTRGEGKSAEADIATQVDKQEGDAHAIRLNGDFQNQWSTGTNEGNNTEMYKQYKDLFDNARQIANLTPADLANVKAGKESWGASRSATTMKIMECVQRAIGNNLDRWNNLPVEVRQSVQAASIPNWLIDKATDKDVEELEDSNYHAVVNSISQARPDLSYHDTVKEPAYLGNIQAALKNYSINSARPNITSNPDGTFTIKPNDDREIFLPYQFVTNAGSPIPHDGITVYGMNTNDY